MVMGYALHAFQKKSRKGKKTSQQDLELVKRRLRHAAEIHAGQVEGRGESDEEEG